MQRQRQRANTFNLIINTISIWNTIYLKKSINYKNSISENIDESLLKNISLLSWSHINTLGEYTFNFDEDNDTNIISH
ncbi:MAG: Tn3 family transposase [Sarcina sp.]